MNTPKVMKVLQPRAGEIWHAPETPVDMKYVVRDGKVVSYKFFFQTGGILYVPVPHVMGTTDDDVSLGAMNA
jgi:hypothetical protein